MKERLREIKDRKRRSCYCLKGVPEENNKEEVVCKKTNGASLVAQWLRIHLPMQGTRVRALVREDPTCRGAAKPMRHNY